MNKKFIIKKKDFIWSIKVIIREWQKPNHPLTKNLVVAIKSLLKMPYDFIYSRKKNGIVAVYDLNLNPATFDFAYFICAAQSFSKTHGVDSFYLYLIKKDNKVIQAHEEYIKVVSEDLIDWKFKNIVTPLISMCNQCDGYAIINSPKKLLINNSVTYPPKYSNFIQTRFEYKNFFSLVNGDNFIGLSSPKNARNYVEKFLSAAGVREEKYNKLITISLRDYSFDVNRNSNIDAWIMFANKIKEDGYIPIFIPDADKENWSFDLLKEFLVYTDASINIYLRMAVYELAYLNLFVNSGVVNIAILNKKVSFIVFNLVNENSHGAKQSYWNNIGIEIGVRHFSFSNERQVLVWEKDSFDVIYSEFLEFIKLDVH